MRLVILADTHCGHLSGLTPPAYQCAPDAPGRRGKFASIQRAMWDWYAARLDALQPIDRLICNGDMIDGQGKRSGGTELITSDRDEQCDMAEQAIKHTRAPVVHMIYGTPYHTGQEEDWEAVLAASVGADIASHEWYDAGGIIIDCKHKVSSSIIPHGRHTGPARDALWNALWAERELQPRAQIFIRSHVHYHTYCGDPRQLIMTTPCMQAHTKYGSRQCVGVIDLGFIVIDIEEEYAWHAEMMDMSFMAARAKRL